MSTPHGLRLPSTELEPSGSAWPPPPTAQRPWEDRRLTVAGHDFPATVRVRTVRLWGKFVQINERSEVYCRGCHEFLTVETLGAIDNHHNAGPPWRAGGLVRAYDGEADEVRPRRDRGVAEMGF